MIFWIGFIIGVIIGAILGGCVIAILANNKFSDWAIEYTEKLKKEYNIDK